MNKNKTIKHPNKALMLRAIREAEKSIRDGQYPLGAVVVRNGRVIAAAHTTLHQSNDPSAHAEVNAIRAAAKKARSRYLNGMWLYTTQEPCPMCASLAVWAKMEGIVFGSTNAEAYRAYQRINNRKFSGRKIDIPAEKVLSKGDPKLKLVKNFMLKDCTKLYDLAKD